MKRNRMFLAADWPATEIIGAGTTLRKGGISRGAYHSLNLAGHVDDDPEKVAYNRRLIHDHLQLPSQPQWLNQVHGLRAVDAEKIVGPESADAIYTDKKGVVCAVLTADCLPVLLCSRDGWCIAAVHAGWRGLLAGVIENTVKKMLSPDLMAWLGPAIGPACFEVGGEVRDAFLYKSSDFALAFTLKTERTWLADLYKIARIILEASGVERIYGGGFCTMTDSEQFFSYRRDGITGRNATLIWKKNQ